MERNMSDVVNKVKELLTVPYDLCKRCGTCCRISIFRGGLSYEEIKQLATSTTAEPNFIEGAKDFLSVFVPYETNEEAIKAVPGLANAILKEIKKEPDQITFFHCKYLGDNNLCKIHEDRPFLCRIYPVPHEKTIFSPDCGLKSYCQNSWKEIEKILDSFKENQETNNSK